MKYKRENVSTSGLTKAILVALGTGALINAALMFPAVGIIYKELNKEKWEKVKKRGTLRATIKRLEKQDLITWTEINKQTILKLTDMGKKRVLQYDLDNLRLVKPQKWDGLYRVVIFDIPETKKVARETFRKKLRELEFYQLQKSVFVSPFPCIDEIDFLRHTYEISPYVNYFETKEISNIKLERWFLNS